MKVGGASGEEVEGVGEQGEDSAERGAGSGGAAGEVEDEGAAAGAADGSAERGEGGVEEAVASHALGKAVDEAVADEARGFRGDVAGGEAGSAGGDQEVMGDGVGAEGGGDLVELVGEGEGADGANARFRKEADDGGAGEVGLLAAEAAVADGEDDGPGVWGKALVHMGSLRERGAQEGSCIGGRVNSEKIVEIGFACENGRILLY
jgi:hypothetical protein